MVGKGRSSKRERPEKVRNLGSGMLSILSHEFYILVLCDVWCNC